MKKELCVTNDYYDEVYYHECHYSKEHLDAMMKYSASLGTERFEWVVDTMWSLYDEDSPLGYDLLREACDAAHRHGMRFDVIYKPFEGGISNPVCDMPHTFPRIDGIPVIENESGIVHNVRPFVAEHPEMRIARRKGDGEDPGGKVTAIRIIKNDDSEIKLDPKDISFWYSSYNGNYKKYEGSFECDEGSEWKLYFPYDDKFSRTLTFTGFDFPEDARYFLVRCAVLNEDGCFANHIESLVELINDKGEVIPVSASTYKKDPAQTYHWATRGVKFGITNYLRNMEVRQLINNADVFKEQCEEMHVFGAQWHIHVLDRDGEIAVKRGKPKHVTGSLHPIYPEVRRHWLKEIQYCIDRNVDGVNIRVANHNRVNEPWAYGFNQPVLEKLKNKDDVYEASIVNGNAFDQFMLEAADLLHGKEKEIGVHVNSLMLRPSDCGVAPGPIPENFIWNWEMWLNEIVDYVEFRGSSILKFQNVKGTVDHIGYVAEKAGIPFIYQSVRDTSVIHYDGPHPYLAHEMDWAMNHPHITCYNLYETANFSRVNKAGVFEGSPEIANLINDKWIKST